MCVCVLWLGVAFKMPQFSWLAGTSTPSVCSVLLALNDCRTNGRKEFDGDDNIESNNE